LAKNLKINIKNAQLASALNLKGLKTPVSTTKSKKPTAAKKTVEQEEELSKKPKVRIVEAPIEQEVTPSKPEAAPQTQQTAPLTIPETPLPAEPIPVPAPVVEPTVTEKTGLGEEKKVPLPQKEEAVQTLATTEIEEEATEIQKKKKDEGFKDFKSLKKTEERKFDSRARRGLVSEDDEAWRKKRNFKQKKLIVEEKITRPNKIKVKLPISIKDLASEMKIKASEIIAKLLLQGTILTLNDLLDDEVVVQVLGHDFGCEIAIDVSEEQRLRITDMTIKEEISKIPMEKLTTRPPVVTFMGHVDHGKTSLIDAIRSTNMAAKEAGAITQHIGAFYTQTPSGIITILDTPGHEAFIEMRERGAMVTDIVVLVIAGDEGIREQTIEAMNQAKTANVPIIVAINKSDKPGFDPEKVYRQLADLELLPEIWGGKTITVNCSAAKKTGIKELLEMICLQAEVLELKANPDARARGTILESEMHKGLGVVATILVQNGTLHCGDAIVFGTHFGKVKTIHNQFDQNLQDAEISMPVKITGLSDLAEAGCEFIVVQNEKTARELAYARQEGHKASQLKQTKKSIDIFMEKKKTGEKKILPIIIKADVQGSLEALKSSLAKIKSEKVELNIVGEGIGEIAESDIQLAAASKAVIIGFHTQMESHAESLIKQCQITVKEGEIIYHLIDDVKALMKSLLNKIEQEIDRGSVLVKAIFKSSQYGIIAGCVVQDGFVNRNHFVRILRNKEIIHKGKITSLKRQKDDVKEVQKGIECGIVIDGFNTIKEGDIIQTYDITYLEQDL